jgi:hypothetical protein
VGARNGKKSARQPQLHEGRAGRHPRRPALRLRRRPHSNPRSDTCSQTAQAG